MAATTTKVLRSLVRRQQPSLSLAFKSRITSPKPSLFRSHLFNNNKRATCFFSTSSPPPPPPEAATTATPTEQEETKGESFEFQAETRQLLDIVTNSLYTDKEVFLRELISNASDALEKMRHLQTANHSELAETTSNQELEIRIETNDKDNTISITDTGIGMTKEDMVEHLGTIAKSGSKAFLNTINNDNENTSSTDTGSSIIGKFGVGFYSAFMVGDSVQVQSKTAFKTDTTPLTWTSTGIGSYDISESILETQNRGSTVTIQLKDNAHEYANETTVEGIVKKYSNFVNFPLYVNGKRVNTMEAIWAQDPKSITKEKYTEFYKYVANAFDEPLDYLHYVVDAPLELKALLFIPSFHGEKYGMGRMEASVSLYSRKVLIESASSAKILPDWLRFVKGVVDSEDLPLSISRETTQDSALVQKIKKALTRKIINHLQTMAKKKPDKYQKEFYKEYAFFLKEGVCQDYEWQEPLSKLLYFDTSKATKEKLTSLEDYVSNCTPEQKDIYYICAPNRTLALQSPYMETFDKANIEVIFLYTPIDEFVMTNLGKFQNRTITSVEKGDIDLGTNKDDETKDETKDESTTSVKLSDTEADEFCAWFQVTLNDKVSSCKVTNRLTSSPAVVTNNESGAMRKMMQYVETQGVLDAMPSLPKQTVEINVEHDLITGLNTLRVTQPELAQVCAEQIYDNCLVAAGLLDDGRSMLGRLNDILLRVVKDGSSVTDANDSNTNDNTTSSSTKQDTATKEEEEKVNDTNESKMKEETKESISK